MSEQAVSKGALPTQVATWRPENYDTPAKDGVPSAGQWLHCLKGTRPFDRQLVWSGVQGDGIVAVVDFEGAVRRRSDPAEGGRALYEGWGRIQQLTHPVSVSEARTDERLAPVFEAPIMSVRGLDRSVAEAVAELAQGFPPSLDFADSPPRWEDEGGNWGPVTRLRPEAIVEAIVRDKKRVSTRVGFPPSTRINPDGKRKRLRNGRYPDLWCAHGVVGDAKNRVRADWGPAQIEDYIDQCQLEWPEHRWRGVLVQNEPSMGAAAVARLGESKHRDRIEVYAVRRKLPLIYEVKRLFPL